MLTPIAPKGGGVAALPNASLPETATSLSADALENSRRVLVGTMYCEGGDRVQMVASNQQGYFELKYKKMRYTMHPVESQSGAVRLEDRAQDVMWLQLGHKSMLMSQRRGTRLADDCAGEEQADLAKHLKLNPAPDLLEPVHPANQLDPVQGPAALLSPVVVDHFIRN